MVLPNEPLPWQSNVNETFIPLMFNREVVGFCKPEYAAKLAHVMNDEQKARKALYLVCADFVKRSQGRVGNVDELVEEYLERAAIPRTGARAIALLLKNRQEELGVTDKEFVTFCDSYRLSPEKLKDIYSGQGTIESTLFAPIARVLGQSVEEVVQIIQG
ncbi:MAG: hypothetical protein WBA43_18505 [Elainellaceae cyanobacterium]